MEIFIVCLFQDNRCLLIVDRQEYQISAGLFCFIKLYGEIGIVIRCKCLAGYYLQTLIRGLCYEGLADTIGVLAGAVVDDSDLGCQFVLADVLSGCTSLIRIRIAYAECVVAGNTLNSRSGRSQLEQVICCCLCYNCDTRLGSNSTKKHLHVPVF